MNTDRGVLSLLGANQDPQQFQQELPRSGGNGVLMDLALLMAQRGQGQGGMSSGMTGGMANADSGHWEDVARQMAAKQGWGPQDFNYIDWIIGGGGPGGVTAESNWNPNAVNPSSGAYGIPQILPQAHPDVQLQNDPQGQIGWLMSYLKQRYGSPQAAYQHKTSTGWY